MPDKFRDTRGSAKRLINAYAESLVGLFALRLPGVAEIVRVTAPEMSVASSYPRENTVLHAADVAARCAGGGIPTLAAAVEQITSVFVAAMWDLLMSHASYHAVATKPEVQFFRHLRNACSHDGYWNLSKLEHPARWRDKELTLAHTGTKVFGGLLNAGDPALLFIDIDRAYFERPR